MPIPFKGADIKLASPNVLRSDEQSRVAVSIPPPLCQTSATVLRIEERWDLDAPPVDFVAWG